MAEQEDDLDYLIDRLGWHVIGESDEVLERWLTKFLQLAASTTQEDLLQRCSAAAVSSSKLVRLMKTSNETILELASRAITYMDGQGEHSVTHTFERADGQAPLTIRVQEASYAGEGETLGAKVWPSAPHLCRMLSASPALVAGRDVLEIGCGPGLCGIAAAKLGALSVLVTDYVPSVVENAQRNIEINDCTAVAVARILDWTKIHEEESALSGQYMTVLAADVIYDDWHAAAVPPVIAAALAPCLHHSAHTHTDAPSAHTDFSPSSHTAAPAHPLCPVCVVVLGDRSARHGIAEFERQMSLHGFAAVVSDTRQIMSRYLFVRAACATCCPSHTWPALPPLEGE
eukprot:m.18733 g.18733  ORF g.18733 m.18733 type:complete len:344 (-) comp7431_c1_seq1:301-1332(-)